MMRWWQDLKMQHILLILGALACCMLVGAFYYFHIRPMRIVTLCEGVAMREAQANLSSKNLKELQMGTSERRKKEIEIEAKGGWYNKEDYAQEFNECLAHSGVFDRKFYKASLLEMYLKSGR